MRHAKAFGRLTFAAVTTALAPAATAGLETFDTQGFLPGQLVGAAPNDISPEFSLTYTGPGVGASVFDSSGEAFTDPDLLVDQGFVLIAQDRGRARGEPAVFRVPDDEGQPGNVFRFDFTDTVDPAAVPFVVLLSVDLIDLDDGFDDEIVVTDAEARR